MQHWSTLHTRVPQGRRTYHNEGSQGTWSNAEVAPSEPSRHDWSRTRRLISGWRIASTTCEVWAPSSLAWLAGRLLRKFIDTANRALPGLLFSLPPRLLPSSPEAQWQGSGGHPTSLEATCGLLRRDGLQRDAAAARPFRPVIHPCTAPSQNHGLGSVLLLPDVPSMIKAAWSEATEFAAQP